jgi:FlaG/FlaF family flagellin (archaellin)
MKMQNDTAVSPVVGVMLMLVVTIIIAAVISGFAGGLVGDDTQKAPKLTMDVRIANGGYYTNSFFAATVTGVDKGIPTKDLKLVTAWTKKLPDGTMKTGGNTVIPNEKNVNLTYQPCAWLAFGWWNYTAPQGYGPGVDGDAYFWPVSTQPGVEKGPKAGPYNPGEWDKISNVSWFGNYALTVGTSMYARPFGWAATPSQGGYPGSSFTVGYGMSSDGAGVTEGGGQYNYAYGKSPRTGGSKGGALFEKGVSKDQMMAMLGDDWNLLRAGDTVTVKMIHIPSNKVIWQKDVTVEG